MAKPKREEDDTDEPEGLLFSGRGEKIYRVGVPKNTLNEQRFSKKSQSGTEKDSFELLPR